MRLSEVLEKVWSAIDEIENIDFDQTGEEIKRDLLGHHRYYNVDGVIDQVNNCLQELQTIVDEYKRIEEDIGIDLITLFDALNNGYWNKGGYYSDTILKKKELHFTKPKEAYISFTWYSEKENEDDFDCTVDEGGCLCLHEMEYEDPQYAVRVKDYGKTWALTKEELL